MGELDVEEVEGVIGDAKAAADKLRAAGLTEEAAAMDEMVAKLEEALHAHHEAEDKKKEAELAHASGEAAAEAAALADAAGALADKLEAAGLKEEAVKLHEFQAVLEKSESTGKDLQDAAHGAHELAEKLRADGHLVLADEMEKLALQLDGAAEKKLGVEALEAEKAAKDGLKDVAAGAHALADRLREDGHDELADMVEKIAKEVDHALEGELDVEEVERVIGDAKAAADKLRAAGLTEEAAAMDEMVAKLEEALHAHHEAEDKKKEAELAAAS